MKKNILAVIVISFSLLSFGLQVNQADLIGEWSVGFIEFDGKTIMCNACPQIEFQSNHIALLRLPNNEIEKYSWSVSDKTITLKNESMVGDKTYFVESEYSMSFENKSNYLKLKLTNRSGTIYNLGKTITGANKK